MQIKHLSQLAVASCVSAQTLQDILQAQNATLSILNGFIQQQQALFDSITDASDITVLAPNNVALSTLPQPVVDRVENDPNFLAALLRYHVLNGTYYNSNLTATHSPIFIQTLLNSTSYVNVTGGQRIISDINADTGDVSLWSGALNPAKVQAAVRLSPLPFPPSLFLLSHPFQPPTHLPSAGLQLHRRRNPHNRLHA